MDKNPKPVEFGKYQLISKIGEGGMAEIYKAAAPGLDNFTKVLVIKRILPAFSKNQSFIKMFIDEAKLSSILQHGNIIQIYELGEVNGQYYIAMEYVNGRDLQRTMARANKIKKQFREELALYTVSEICKGLHYAHTAKDSSGKPLKIIHRDVSPSNVIISFEGNVKIMDFGVAKARTTGGKLGGIVLTGKLGYMAPEQVMGKTNDQRSDLFSLGIILFEILTMKRLFLGRNDLETLINVRTADLEKRLTRHPEISPGVADIIRKAANKDIEQRFQTGLEFMEAIQDYLYNHKIKVHSSHLADFMEELFPGEIDQEFVPIEIDEVSVIRPTKFTESTSELSAQIKVAGISEKVRKPVISEKWVLKEQLSEAELMDKLKGASFQFMDADGHIFGPIEYSNLQKLMQARAISDNELCSIDGTEWTSFREMISVIKKGVKEKLISPNERLLVDGQISKKTFPRLFYDISIARFLTGKLVLKQKVAYKEIHFKTGKPKHIVSNLKRELFGEFLKEKGVLSEAILNTVISEIGGSSEFLGDHILKKGFIRPHELASLLDAQFRDKLIECFSWNEGWFGFFSSSIEMKNVYPVNVDPLQIIIEGIRQHYNLEILKDIFKDYFSREIEKVENKFLVIQDLKLSPRETRIYSSIISHQTLQDLGKPFRSTPEDEFIFFRTIFLLLQINFIRFK
jgi:serine/threonine-protein kinase